MYISSTSLPGTYAVGVDGWADDPYYPAAQSFVIKIPRNPVAANSTSETPFGLGTSGILLNGVALYNANDGNSYNDSGFWYRNAYFFEGYSFDNCVGHPSVGSGTVITGLYHHHALPICFDNANSTSGHSPLLGYALDGFPIYGPYGYSDPMNSTSDVVLLNSSYYAGTYANGQRTTYGNGTTITDPTNYGPSEVETYQLNSLDSTSFVNLSSGAFLYDYIFDSTYGDLNAFNGRFQVTPEYPLGIFCYIFTSDYPYLFGPGNYYGVVASTATTNSIDEPVTDYFDYNASG